MVVGFAELEKAATKKLYFSNENKVKGHFSLLTVGVCTKPFQ